MFWNDWAGTGITVRPPAQCRKFGFELSDFQSELFYFLWAIASVLLHCNLVDWHHGYPALCTVLAM